MDASQQPLPFGSAEGIAAERRTRLRMAVAAAGGDLYLRVFCDLVLDAAERGCPYDASYKQIAAAPNGLCCSPGKARTTVAEACRLQLVFASEGFDGAAQKANRYGVHWEGVARILRGDVGEPRLVAAVAEARQAEVGSRAEAPAPASRDGPTHVTVEHRGATTAHPGATTWHPPATTAQGAQPPLGTRARARIPELNTNTYPEPEPVPEPVPDYLPSCGNALPTWIEEYPILAEAKSKRIRPKPIKQLYHGAFEPLLEKHLRSVPSMVDWFRGQLATPRPVLGPSETELLFTLALAKYALAQRSADVTKSRVALFVYNLTRRVWKKAMPYIPAAREELDRAIAEVTAQGHWTDLYETQVKP